MVTNLPTGDYLSNADFQFLCSFFYPLILILAGNVASSVVATSKEKNEHKLLNILKRIGYREVVDVY